VEKAFKTWISGTVRGLRFLHHLQINRLAWPLVMASWLKTRALSHTAMAEQEHHYFLNPISYGAI
jgi:hypothetical protein